MSLLIFFLNAVINYLNQEARALMIEGQVQLEYLDKLHFKLHIQNNTPEGNNLRLNLDPVELDRFKYVVSKPLCVI